VAFLLGGALSFPKLHRYGKEILITSFVVVTVSVLVVGGGLLALGVGALQQKVFLHLKSIRVLGTSCYGEALALRS